ncbi:MAG TPA: S24 family peptidase, partial [Gemmatimonadaceae bacterium]|nr:S24 family peptidase [Gemmatimonadaceae bacterium]
MTAPRPPLTPIEDELYRFLIDFLAEHTYQPSVREIGKALKIPSTKSVADLLTSLSNKGYVRKEPGRSRGLSLVGFAGAIGTMPVPLMALDPATGTLAAEDSVTLDRRLVGAPDAFLVRALPLGAPAHGVVAGDLVLVHPSARAHEGDLIVARVGGAVLVRPFVRRGATLVLGTGA